MQGDDQPIDILKRKIARRGAAVGVGLAAAREPG